MTEKVIPDLISRYESGLCTASEIAGSILYELVARPMIDQQLSWFKCLPDDIKVTFVRLLQSIREADYQWTPFLLCTRSEPLDPRKYSAKLRVLIAMLLGPCE